MDTVTQVVITALVDPRYKIEVSSEAGTFFKKMFLKATCQKKQTKKNPNLYSFTI